MVHQTREIQAAVAAHLDTPMPGSGALFDIAAVGFAELDPDRRWVHVNGHLRRMLGYTAGGSLPATFDELTHEEDRDVDSVNAELMTAGVLDGYRQERRLRCADQSFLWVETSMTAVRDASGAVVGIAAVVHDISRHKDIEQRQRTLLGEMAHRSRNLFAILQTLARHSLTEDRSPGEAYVAFQGRLRALADSLNTLTHTENRGITLDVLLRRALHAMGRRAVIAGPPIVMMPNAGQTFALVAHELATNAIKYGALSTSTGTLSVQWTVTGSGDAARLHFEWRETGGPPATPPSRRGFGSFLTRDVAGVDFDCEPLSSYGANGFEYRLEAPLSRVGTLVVESAVRRTLKDSTVRALYDAWVHEQIRAGGLPSIARFEWTVFAATGAMVVGKVHTDGSVQITQVGRLLRERLGRPWSPGDVQPEGRDEANELYERCARKAAPCHHYLRFDFGSGEARTFERLAVPFADTPCGPVSHVIAMALFTGETDDLAQQKETP